jgi:hypothetical protein
MQPLRRGVAELDAEENCLHLELFSANFSDSPRRRGCIYSDQIILKLPVIITRRYLVNVSGVVMPSPVGVAML